MGDVTTLRWIAALIVVGAVAVAPASAGSSPAPACRSVVHKGVLPAWARTGFSDPRPRLPHVLGRSGEIAALVFGYPLRSPAQKDRGNKIGHPVTRVVVGGPGPSGIDLPAPGCWRLKLRWSGRSDELDLRYVSP